MLVHTTQIAINPCQCGCKMIFIDVFGDERVSTTHFRCLNCQQHIRGVAKTAAAAHAACVEKWNGGKR